jgi:hypothetical protein
MSEPSPVLDPAAPRWYGGWRLPKSPGIMGFDLLSSGVLVGALVVCIFTLMLAGFLATVAVGLMSAAVLTLLIKKNAHHESGLQRLLVRVAWRQIRLAGSNHYRSGPLGKSPRGTYQLPGLLANTKLYEYTDAWGRPFAILELPTRAHYSISFKVEPEGSSLVDQDQVNLWVGRYAAVLKQLGDEPGLIAAQVTVETAPDRGSRLRRYVMARMDDNAPEVSKAMLRDVVESYPAGSASVRIWVALTFSTSIHGKRLSVDEFADAVKPRLRGLGEQFHGTGVGGASALTAQQLCELVRIAYNPSAAAAIEDANLAGNPVSLRWHDVGPAGADSFWDCYVHDDALSITWAMTEAPRGVVRENILQALLQPTVAVPRKRVTMLYRILDPATAARTVDADVASAQTAATATKRPRASKVRELELAVATAKEEASGAALTDFALMVTATVDGNDQVARQVARATVESLGQTARLSLRPLYGSQDSAFVGGLPIGVALPEYMAVPREIRRLGT